ncbi:META domain-containing protein [Pseudoalteromonas ulvae]|uniref:DUF306 domain-containing protein n=1 Tax=Pseudoalteromonas ulvae TaxID=107327 RepID=A0A244CQ82_PSEDV|nr:META domain-containing protein [Pseudoalteromonas ulvae]OUL57656.1 hypothetical protein B1199_11365 [Pseudoalteromonas ulvae]
MKLAAIIVCFSLFFLIGCQSTQTTITQQLTPHTFQLMSVDQHTLANPTLTLRFSEGMRVNGFAGCNQFFGQGIISDDGFRVEQLGMTRKSCPTEINELEQLFFSMLSHTSTLKLNQDTLMLNGDNQLKFIKVTTHTE